VRGVDHEEAVELATDFILKDKPMAKLNQGAICVADDDRLPVDGITQGSRHPLN
jgi:hypothetical protein